MKLLKNNLKFYIIMAILILLGTVGITLALNINSFDDIAVNTTSSVIEAKLEYDDTDISGIFNIGNMFPIEDNLVTGPDVTDSRVFNVVFYVSGAENNPNNTIYDVAMYFSNIDCALRTKDLKWRLYKNNVLLNEGTLSTEYDTMANNRLVLTNIQEDLSTSTDKYVFLLWISESCTGDIGECDSSLDQSKYLNKSLNGTIKVELSTGSKKEIERITAPEETCSYIETEIPVCNELTYNGQEQLLIGENTSSVLNNTFNYKMVPLSTSPIADTAAYLVSNNVRVNAGSYPVILKPNEGYKWTDGSINEKNIYCTINKKDLIVTTLDQEIVYGNKISSNVNNVSVDGVVGNNSLNNVSLSSSIVNVGVGVINTNNIYIVDAEGNDVTYNYNVKRKNTGKVTITCLNQAEEPIVSDKQYNGEIQNGVTGGKYIQIQGVKSATNVGIYNIVVVPQKNYCWADGTTEEKNYTWNIIETRIASFDY